MCLLLMRLLAVLFYVHLREGELAGLLDLNQISCSVGAFSTTSVCLSAYIHYVAHINSCTVKEMNKAILLIR